MFLLNLVKTTIFQKLDHYEENLFIVSSTTTNKAKMQTTYEGMNSRPGEYSVLIIQGKISPCFDILTICDAHT